MARKTMVELLAEINTLFPDNNVGEISPADLRTFCQNFVDSVTPAYGVLSTTSLAQVVGVTLQTLPWQATFIAQAPEFTTDPAAGIVRRDQSIISNRISVNIDVEIAANRECEAVLYANGVATPWRTKVSGNGTTRPESIQLEALHYSDIPVDYSVRVAADQAGTAMTFSNGIFLVSAVPVRTA